MSDRLRVLWIPHTSWAQCKAQRPWFLVEGLAERFEIHVLTWDARPSGASRSYYLNPASHLGALSRRTEKTEIGFLHNAGVPLPVLQAFSKGYPSDRAVAFSEWCFQRNIRKLHKKWKFAAAVVSASHHFTGYPPELKGVPCIFDYVDTSPDKVEAHYVSQATSIVSVSNFLKDRLLREYNRESVWIPNGLCLERIAGADRAAGRAKWGLEGKKVVSLIGLTCSERLYFLDALAMLKDEFPDLVFVGAGCGRVANNIAARAAELGVPAVMTGWIEHAQIPDLFAASDVGLYPGDESVYYDGACPLKLLEYAGAGVPTVASNSAELRALGFQSMIIRPATAEAFAAGIREALTRPRERIPQIAQFDWPMLVARFGDVIERAVSLGVT